jgi:hypothetical protein
VYINRRNGFVLSIFKEVLWGSPRTLLDHKLCTLAEFWKHVLVSLQTQKEKSWPTTYSIIEREDLSVQVNTSKTGGLILWEVSHLLS